MDKGRRHSAWSHGAPPTGPRLPESGEVGPRYVHGPFTRSRRFVAFTLRYGRWIWAVALLLAVPATWRTATLYLHLKSDLEELLPREAESVRAIDELRKRMPGLQYLGVVVDAGDPSKVPAAERLIDDLASRVGNYPNDLVRRVSTGTGQERAFIEAHAPLYMSLDDLKTIRARILARRDYDVSRATGAALDDEAPPPLEFGDIQEKYERTLPSRGEAEGDRYSSKKLHLSMLLMEVSGFDPGSHQTKELLARVKSEVSALGGPDAYAHGMRLGYAGDVAISVEETDALMSDLSLSSVLVICAVAGVIVFYFRWWRSVLVLIPPLVLATVYAFALASLPPFNVTDLNSNTAFLGSIIVGNGINFGIVLLARYVEERRKGRAIEDALTTGVWSSRAGTLAAALGAGVSYAALIVTQFRGFRQFGIIGGLGMVLSWGVAFICMPPLAAWLDRDGSAARRRPREPRLMAPLGRMVVRYRVPVVVVGLLVTCCAVAKVGSWNLDQLESDFSKLRRADTWEVGEGYWGKRMDALLGEYLTPTVLLADSAEQARAMAARLRAAGETSPLGDAVATIRTIDDVLPEQQTEKMAEAAEIRSEMTPKMRSLLPAATREAFDRLMGDGAQVAIGIADLPPALTTALVERDGSVGRAVLVYPRLASSLWRGATLEGFVRELRAVAHVGGEPATRVAGTVPLSADILGSIRRDGPLASGVAFLGVVLGVVVMFRRQATTLYVVASLTVGVAWLMAATIVLGVKINFANFIAFPITFGIGVDYAVNVMSRYVQDGRRDITQTIGATGGAVALCSMTTIIGYSSLLVAQNRALFLFGLIAVIGEVACLTAAVTLLPSVLTLVDHRPALRPRPDPSAGE